MNYHKDNGLLNMIRRTDPSSSLLKNMGMSLLAKVTSRYKENLLK